MTKKRRDKIRQQLRELNKNKVCENCGKEHNHTYGTGRFCSSECAHAFAGSKVTEVRLKHLEKIHKLHKASYGTWKCNVCQCIFETRNQLNQHYKETKHKLNSPNIVENNYVCPFCNRVFQKQQQAVSHVFQCKLNPNYNEDLEKNRHIKSAKTFKQRYKNGEISGAFKGKHHSIESKRKMREAAISRIEKMVGPFQSQYNLNSIKYLDDLSKKMNWHLQHAENGGEVRIDGYFLDAYDKNLNIVVEYDELVHYIDVEKNILQQKDIERQNYIIQKLHCQFYRYNEKTKTLWKVI